MLKTIQNIKKLDFDNKNYAIYRSPSEKGLEIFFEKLSEALDKLAR